MRPRLRWAPTARTDLFDIYGVIARHDPLAAERFFDRIEERARQLSAFPRLGPRRDDIRPGYRCLVEGAYLILYRLAPEDEGPVDTVEIVRVIDGRRHLSRLV